MVDSDGHRNYDAKQQGRAGEEPRGRRSRSRSCAEARSRARASRRQSEQASSQAGSRDGVAAAADSAVPVRHSGGRLLPGGVPDHQELPVPATPAPQDAGLAHAGGAPESRHAGVLRARGHHGAQLLRGQVPGRRRDAHQRQGHPGAADHHQPGESARVRALLGWDSRDGRRGDVFSQAAELEFVYLDG